jgi:hypothetical protein
LKNAVLPKIPADYQHLTGDWNDIQTTLTCCLQASVATFHQEGIVERMRDYPWSYRANGGLLVAFVAKGGLANRRAQRVAIAQSQSRW